MNILNYGNLLDYARAIKENEEKIHNYCGYVDVLESLKSIILNLEINTNNLWDLVKDDEILCTLPCRDILDVISNGLLNISTELGTVTKILFPNKKELFNKMKLSDYGIFIDNEENFERD